MRFKFGKNWKSFLQTLTDEKIDNAEKCLEEMIALPNMQSMSFIDIGSGSGLMSLAAKRKGADVTSFDYDVDSVEATAAVKQQFSPNDDSWKVERGSVLDDNYINNFPKFDIVYSWGVLHHTGNMHKALENAASLVKPNGKLFIALYNDQGFTSKMWKRVKMVYNANAVGRFFVKLIFIPYFYGVSMLADLVRHGNPMKSIRGYKNDRGMNFYHDVIDWIGGYPFEVASPGYTFNFFKNRGFTLENMKTTTSLGCNEYVFVRKASY